MAKFELGANAAPSFNDKTLQQARFQSSSTIDLPGGARLHVSPSHTLPLIAISRSARSRAVTCPGSGVKCHVSRDMGSWNSMVRFFKKPANLFCLRAQACDCVG
jgi:hypothetical protein